MSFPKYTSNSFDRWPRRTTMPAVLILIGGILIIFGVWLIGPERFGQLKFAAGGLLIGVGLRIFADLVGEIRDQQESELSSNSQ